MRARATRAGVDRDRMALVEDRRHLVEIAVARADQWASRMNGVRRFLLCRGIGDVSRHHEHGDAALRQRRLARGDRLAPGLFGCDDRLTEYAAALEYIVEIDLLDRLEADIVPDDLRRDQDDRRAIAVGLVEAVDEVEATRTTG